jgi:hypothetical protein
MNQNDRPSLGSKGGRALFLMLNEAELEIARLADIKRVIGAAKNVQIPHALTTMPRRLDSFRDVRSVGECG